MVRPKGSNTRSNPLKGPMPVNTKISDNTDVNSIKLPLPSMSKTVYKGLNIFPPNYLELQSGYCNISDCDSDCKKCLFYCDNLNKFKKWYQLKV